MMSSMQLKNSCRLCLSKEGEFYGLFDATTLADELKSLLNFEITNKENLPGSICSLCYKINVFFKEFRDNCVRVNDYFNKVEAQKCPPIVSPVTIKTEKIDDLVDVSVGGSKTSKDEELLTRGNRTADCEDTPYPVALVTSTYNKNLEALKSNFVSGRNLTDDVLGNIPEIETHLTNVPSRRGKKRKNENFEDTQNSPDNSLPQDMLLATIKTEPLSSEDSEEQTDKFGSELCLKENNAGDHNAEEDLYSSNVNSVRNNESVQDSGSNILNGSVETYNEENLSERLLSKVGKEASELHITKRTKLMPVVENKGKSNRRTDQNSSPVGSPVDHLLKQEEIDLYEPPLEQSNDSASSDEQNSPDESYLSDSDDIDKGPSVRVEELRQNRNSSMYQAVGRVSSTELPFRLIDRHFPSFIPPTASKRFPARRCKVCCSKFNVSGKRIRKETRYYCKECDTGICAAKCFEIYHTILNF